MMDSFATIAALANALGGGGAKGLEIETGTYVSTEDTATPSINFKNTHETKPSFIMILLTAGGYPNGCVDYWVYASFIDALGANSNSFTTYSAKYWYRCKTTSGSQSETSSSLSSSTSTYPVSKTRFVPITKSDNTCMYRTTNTYKWIAVWTPPVS